MHGAGELVTASVSGGEQLFLSRLLRVDAAAGVIVLACSDIKQANSALLAAHAVALACNHEGTHYEFVAARPRETQYRGVLAFELDFPPALVVLQRRAAPRIAVPPKVPLRCELRAGVLSFDAQVIDISLKGMGAVIYDPAIQLERGMRLEARIVHPSRAPVDADVEVRHVSRVQSSDGAEISRAGCRFVGAPQDIEDLIRVFVTELGAR